MGSITYQYDAAGNMIWDGYHHCYYDAENRLIQVDGTLGSCSTPTTQCYVYDAKGTRVRSSAPNGGGSEWIHDLQGHVVAQQIMNFGWGRGFVYLGSQQIAEYSDGTTYSLHSDHLGSTRLVTKMDRSINSYDYLPFGQVITSVPGGNSVLHLFTGKEHDAETATGYGAQDGFDYFGARYYASRLLRLATPDPEQFSARHIANPQLWNRYAYALNNPLAFVDPSGFDPWYVFRPLAWFGLNGVPDNGGDWANAVLQANLRGDTVTIYNGDQATVQAFTDAASTPGAHVLFIGHALTNEEGSLVAIQLDEKSGIYQGLNGSEYRYWDTAAQTPTLNVVATDSNVINAYEVAIFGCNSYGLSNQYPPTTNFVGIIAPTGENSQYYGDAAAANFLANGGGQLGVAAANVTLLGSTVWDDIVSTVQANGIQPPWAPVSTPSSPQQEINPSFLYPF